MRILHVISDLNPANGGPQAVAIRLAAAQVALSHEVHLLCYATPAVENNIKTSVSQVPRWSDVLVHLIPPGNFLEKLTGDNARALASALMPNLDFVHFHGVWESHLASVAAEARARNVPYTVAPHALLDPWSLKQKPLKKKVALLLRAKKFLNAAAFLHALNADEKDRLSPLHLSCPIRVIPNGVFLGEFQNLPHADAFYARFPKVNHRRFALFLSRLHYKKGLDILADAFALFAQKNLDTDLVVAGPDGGMQSQFQAKIGSLGLEDRVHVVGPIYGAAKSEALAAASCFCLPSRSEGFSIAITEALASGVPVVISPECHFPEVSEVGAGEIVPLDGQMVADSMIRVLGRAKECYSVPGRRLVEERFTWPVIAERLVELYKTALKDG